MDAIPSKPRILEVTALSAEDLRLNQKPVKKNVFVVVHAESITSYTTVLSDGDRGGNSFHSWNEKFTVELATHARTLAFEVKCKTATGVKDVGVARIPVSDFLGGMVPDTFLQFLSYRLRDWEGHRNGIINFSVRVAVQPLTVTEYKGSRCDVVTGNPCWWNNHTSNV